MTSEFYCPSCDRKYRGSEELEGRKATCKDCGEQFRIAFFDEVDVIEEEPPRVRSGVARSRNSRRRSQSAKVELTTALLIAGGTGVSLLILVGVMIFAVSKEVEEEQIAADNSPAPQVVENVNELFNYSDIPIPNFPDLLTGEVVGNQGVRISEIKLNGGNRPGQQMTLRVYLPKGNHVDNSLACVLVGPAGSPLITGNSIDGSDYHDESLPYAEAGAVAITFSLDGPFGTNGMNENIKSAYTQFRDAAAGMVNCRNAFEYAIQKIPAVDPQKIVIAGHSSAGSLALLYSVHEPRLAGSIAYCSAADVETRIDEILDETKIQWMLPRIEQFKQKSAPMNHIAKTTCPVFLFHARDDSNCPYSDSTRYHEMLQNGGKESEIKLVDFGDHYQSMIDEGIPSGIEWMRKKGILANPPQNIVSPDKKETDQRPTPESPFIDL